jgi:bla regulator protein BlaR1
MAFFGTNVVREDLSGYFNGLEGSVVLLDQDRDKFTIYNEKKSRGRVSPDSTFKIYAALIGLDAKCQYSIQMGSNDLSH